MPVVRDSITKKIRIGDLKGYVTVGLREDGTPGEVFIHTAKSGSFERGLCHALALMISVCLQNQVPLEKIVEKLKDLHFEPSGVTGDSTIPMCKSLVDYIARWLSMRFLKESK